MIRETDDGLKWLVDEHADNMGAVHEDYLDKDLLALIPGDGVFLDVGAHVGHYTVRAAMGYAAKVIAVEANPDTAARLRENLALNSIHGVLDVVYNVAAWDEVAVLRLHSPNQLVRDGSMRVLPLDDPAGGPYESPAVRGVRLDELLASEPRIDVVKLDVEGADLHALRGMRKLLARCRPVMVIEDHSMYGYYARADLDALLHDLGYRQEPFGPQGGYLLARPK